MIERVETAVEPAKQRAEAVQQGASSLALPVSREPVLGILLGVVISALIWPALLIIWLYVWR